jgi:putative ABC transport system substrate-binding protein
MNNRRKLVIALGAGALTAPLTCFAQQKGKVWRIGFLWDSEQSDDEPIQRFEAFKAGMREFGYAEERDYTVEQRSAQGDLSRLPALVADLLALKIDLIIVQTTPSAGAARNGTQEIPILAISVSDPVSSGLVASLNRPGGNITGLTNGVASELYTKRLDLLRQILPGMRRVGFFYNPDNVANVVGIRQFETDCAKIGIKSIGAPVGNAEKIPAAFKTLHRDKAQALIVTPSTSNISWRASIAEHATKHRLPAAYGSSIFAEAGGLFSYGANYADLFRRAAAYANKIFKGTKPGDLPFEQPIKFEMIVNMKTAKALGIKIPDGVMILADRVIK